MVADHQGVGDQGSNHDGLTVAWGRQAAVAATSVFVSLSFGNGLVGALQRNRAVGQDRTRQRSKLSLFNHRVGNCEHAGWNG